MSHDITILVNGVPHPCRKETSVLAAMLNSRTMVFRSEGGQDHAPICGMGICFECLVKIDGGAPVRACMVQVEDGMEIEV